MYVLFSYYLLLYKYNYNVKKIMEKNIYENYGQKYI